MTELEGVGGVKDAIIEHFRRWLRAGTGCGYAASLAKRGRIAYEAHDAMPPVHELDTSFDQYAKAGLSAFVIFPFVTTEAALADVLAALRGGSPRWKVRRRVDSTPETVRIGLDWSTTNGDVSDAMGFAPLLSMPVPRRAPYFAIGAWPGGRSNPWRGTPPTPAARSGRVSFLDARHDLESEPYTALWTATTGAVGDLMSLPLDSAARYRQVAFVLAATAASTLTFDS